MKNFNNETKRKIIKKYLSKKLDGMFNFDVEIDAKGIYEISLEDLVSNQVYLVKLIDTYYISGIVNVDANNLNNKSLLSSDLMIINEIISDLKIIIKTLDIMESL